MALEVSDFRLGIAVFNAPSKGMNLGTLREGQDTED
jgi:hypothetical protein